MLQLRGVTVRYGQTVAVDEVDLAIADGEVLALLGPSGCGKSTLLRAIAGLEPLSAGTIVMDGVDLARVPVHRRGFGLMFQDGVLFPHLSVAGNIRYGLRGRDGADQRVRELLELVGMAGFDDRRVDTLSGGQAQRVALARALAPRPRLLLLDEPLAALDAALRAQLLADLRTILAETGVTTIFVSHDQDEVFAIADTIAVMRAGRIVQTAPPQRLWREPVDEWTARFLGCEAVLPARPHRRPDGSWVSRSVLGEIDGRAAAIGLRPASLVVDDDGPVAGIVVAVMPGPDRQRLRVRLAGNDWGGTDTAAGSPHGEMVPAVAVGDDPIRPGDRVALHWDHRHTVLLQE